MSCQNQRQANLAKFSYTGFQSPRLTTLLVWLRQKLENILPVPFALRPPFNKG